MARFRCGSAESPEETFRSLCYKTRIHGRRVSVRNDVKISLHIELAPKCPPQIESALQEKLRGIGFEVAFAEAGAFECRQDRFTSLKAARMAVAQIVIQAGGTVLDSRIQVHGSGVWGRQKE